MAGGGERRVVHAGFHMQRWAACRDDDGVPPELALDHPFPGVVLMLGQRPPDVSLEARDAWLLERELPRQLPGSGVALCLSLSPRALPESSPAWTPLPEGWERRTLEVFFLDRDPRTAWSTFFPSLCAGLREARMGDVALAAAFVPTIPGTDRYVDEL
jgi:hypothetical protein